MNPVTQTTNSSGQGRQIEKWVPGLQALRAYQRAWLPRDLIADVINWFEMRKYQPAKEAK